MKEENKWMWICLECGSVEPYIKFSHDPTCPRCHASDWDLVFFDGVFVPTKEQTYETNIHEVTVSEFLPHLKPDNPPLMRIEECVRQFLSYPQWTSPIILEKSYP